MATDYKSIVGVVPKGGLVVPNLLLNFGMTMAKMLKDMFLVHTTHYDESIRPGPV